MKAVPVLCCIALSAAAFAPALTAQTPVDSKNPVVWASDQVYERQAKFIVAAAEEMPAEKYSYKPTADQWTFGKIVSHVTMANAHVCAMLDDQPAPAAASAPETASKAELVAALKASFEFCNTAMSTLKDDKLGDTITFFRGAKVPRARALIEEVGDLEDHYSQMASYLRLNNMTPPSAAPKK